MTLDDLIAKQVSELGLPRDVHITVGSIIRRMILRSAEKCVRPNEEPDMHIETHLVSTEYPQLILVPVLIYAACRQDGVPMTISLLAQNSHRFTSHHYARSVPVIRRNYNAIKNELPGFNEKILAPKDYVPLICQWAAKAAIEENHHNITVEQVSGMQAKAVQMLNDLGTPISRRVNSVLAQAAGAVYTAAVELGIPITQRNIADIADIEELTLRRRYKSMVDQLGLRPVGRTHQALCLTRNA